MKYRGIQTSSYTLAGIDGRNSRLKIATMLLNVKATRIAVPG